MGRKKVKEPDRLAIEASMAKAAKMSYGRWKALQIPQKIAQKGIPDGWRLCEFCGKPFKRNHGQRFCEMDCRNKAYADKEKKIKNEYNRTYKRKESTNESCC